MNRSWFVRGDLDGFFGLFVDNLLQLMLISLLCPTVCGLPSELVWSRILPAAAVPILIGNLFYAWQARELMRTTGRNDVTALPYGINTVSLMAFIFLVMGPVYQATKDADLAWNVGIFACFLNGIFEVVCAFFGDWIRRHTPRAALLSALAGIAVTFIAMGFVFQIFASPIIAVLPMLLILFAYASGTKLPLGIPGGLAAVLVGIAMSWLFGPLGHGSSASLVASSALGLHLPVPMPERVFTLLSSPTGWQYMAVIFPMGLFNVLGALQNLESAEAAGDRFQTRSSMLVNGICSVVGAFFGSAFPTTIYIGHPGWKAMGARSGYSVLNGVVIMIVCCLGGISLVMRWVPVEVALGILLWIGLIMTAQAFQTVPKSHALAVGLGLVPALAAWALLLIETTLRVAGQSLFQAASKFGTDLYIHGVIALSQGFMLSSMILSAMLAHVIDRKFLKASAWCGLAAVMSLTGLIHAYELTEQGVQNKFGFWAAPAFALAYALGALVLLALHAAHAKQSFVESDALRDHEASPLNR
jgi:AGZA family xanthine/uracil permease-like MFS transporter